MFRCIIVEDEQPARELLKMYLDELGEFELVKAFDNAFAAFTFLQTTSVDLMFLDIQMPRMTGIELLRALSSPPKVIITTAFRDYALDAFDLDVIDYLLKPISQDRFFRSICKFNSYAARVPATNERDTFSEAYIFLKVGKEQVKIFLEDILFIEGLKDYIKVHTTGKTHITYERLGYMEQKLPDSHFIRVHKSYIISLAKISVFKSDRVRLAQRELPIGRVYKQNFLHAVAMRSQV